jgi:hypothetical protein
MILKHPVVTERIKNHTFLDKAYRVFGAIAIHPTNTHENDGLMEIHYDGVPLAGTQMTVEQMNANINLVKKTGRKKIVSDFTQARLDDIKRLENK